MDSSNNTLLKSWKNALLVTARAPAYPFVALLRFLVLVVATILYKIGSMLVELTAAFMSAVLSHPDVVNSAANVMVAGMNAFAAQEETNAKQHMTVEDKQEVAVQIGRDLPIFVGGIVHGIFFGNNDNADKQIQKSVQEEKVNEEKEDESKNASGEDDSLSKVAMYVNGGVTGNGEIVEKKLTTSQ